MSKIFGIGYPKTSITTLANCLITLGQTPLASWSKSYNLNYDLHNKNYLKIKKFSQSYKSFIDGPWGYSDLYKHLNNWHPDAKFVLTIREPSKWIASLKKEMWPEGKFGSNRNPKRSSLDLMHVCHEINWGKVNSSIKGKENIYIEKYKKRNKEVINFFKGTSKLLVVDWSKCDGWDELCNFLNCKRPNIEFPHKNRSKK